MSWGRHGPPPQGYWLWFSCCMLTGFLALLHKTQTHGWGGRSCWLDVLATAICGVLGYFALRLYDQWVNGTGKP